MGDGVEKHAALLWKGEAGGVARHQLVARHNPRRAILRRSLLP